MRRRTIGNLSFLELGRRVWSEVQTDTVPTRAAELAFYLTLAFFPFLICVIAALTAIPGAEGILLGYLDTLLPKELAGVIHPWFSSIFQRGSDGLLSLSLLFTFWSASTGLAVLVDVFNVAYEVRERRPFWKVRLVALALTVGLVLLVMGGAFLFIFGSAVLDKLSEVMHFSIQWHILTRVLNHVIGLGMLLLGVSALHYYGPNVTPRWTFFSPGAFVSVILILAASYLFSAYLEILPSYSALYGGLGTVVVFMIWLYVVSFILLIGAEINDEIWKGLGDRPVERV